MAAARDGQGIHQPVRQRLQRFVEHEPQHAGDQQEGTRIAARQGQGVGKHSIYSGSVCPDQGDERTGKRMQVFFKGIRNLRLIRICDERLDSQPIADLHFSQKTDPEYSSSCWLECSDSN